MSIPRHRDWPVDNPEELRRRLGELQDGIQREIERLDRTMTERVRVTGVVRDTYRARFGELVRVDTTAAAVTVLLPKPVTEFAGVPVRVVIVAGANNVTVQPMSGEVDGGASATVTPGTVFTFWPDDTDYWSE